jgi:hypothetical protein
MWRWQVRDPLDAFIDESLERTRKKGYLAPIFRKMRHELGTVEAMRRLAEADVLQSGLRELAHLGLLDWSVEAGVLKFPDRFPARLTRESARFKLERAKESTRA